jgi:hypothetical protein
MGPFPAVLLILFLLSFPVPSVGGQEVPGPVETGASPEGDRESFPFFPLLPLILTVERGEVFWAPDWPLEVPPDAFRVLRERPVSIVLSLGDADYRLRRNGRGLLEEFPARIGGALAQVRVHFGPGEAIRGFTLGTDPEWTVEFPEGVSGEPFIARLRGGEGAYSIVCAGGERGYSETWYDGEDGFLAYFQTGFYRPVEPPRRIQSRTGAFGEGELQERYDYDAFGNISAVDAAGRFSAIYGGENRPRYWERLVLSPEAEETSPSEQGPADPSGTRETEARWFSLQWDERGLLTRITGGTGEEEDYRYEYTLDRRGNWTERQERQMIRLHGALAAGPGPLLKRTIEYGK